MFSLVFGLILLLAAGMIGFAGWFWLHWFWVLAFPICTYLKMVHYRRLNRGKIRRYLIRRYGIHGLAIPSLVGMSLIVAAVASLMVNGGVTDFLLALYWTASFVMDVVDYITGGDDPGRRLKKLASALVKKLTWAPAPRPVIDLR